MNRVLTRPVLSRRPGSQERGAALLLTLAILLILTVLGVSSVQTTSLQEKITRNNRDMNVAFQAARAAILEAEAWLEGMTSLAAFPPDGAAVSCAGGRCRATDGVARWAQDHWDDPATSIRAELGTAQAARYRIEYLASLELSEASSAETDPGDTASTAASPDASLDAAPDASPDTGPVHSHIFRITARATGSTGKAVAMLQTTYGKHLPADALTSDTPPITAAHFNNTGRLSWKQLDSTAY